MTVPFTFLLAARHVHTRASLKELLWRNSITRVMKRNKGDRRLLFLFSPINSSAISCITIEEGTPLCFSPLSLLIRWKKEIREAHNTLVYFFFLVFILFFSVVCACTSWYCIREARGSDLAEPRTWRSSLFFYEPGGKNFAAPPAALFYEAPGLLWCWKIVFFFFSLWVSYWAIPQPILFFSFQIDSSF